MDKRNIVEGDKVDIFFENLEPEMYVEVLYTPCAIGDCFKVLRKDGTIVNVQNYSKMVKRERGFPCPKKLRA